MTLLLVASLLVITPSPPGAVVEGVGAGGSAADAGLEPGQVLVAWRRRVRLPSGPTAAGGPIRSPLDLRLVELEEAPRGPLSLVVLTTAGAERELPLPPGRLRLATRPRLGSRDEAEYRRCLDLLEAGAGEEALAILDELAKRARARGDTDTSAALWAQSAAGEHPRLPEGGREAAIADAAGRLDEPGAAALLWTRLAGVAAAGARLAEAEQAHVLAVHDRTATCTGGLAAASSLYGLGTLADDQARPEAARRFSRQAIQLRQRLVPSGLEVASALGLLGVVEFKSGNLPAAERALAPSIEILERDVPDSVWLANMLINLGGVYWQRGNLAAAEECLQRSLEIHERVGSDRTELATIFGNLGTIATDRLDLEAAEEYQRLALAIWEERAPESREVAMALNNLGNIAVRRDDLDDAAARFQHCLAIYEQVKPASLEVALALNNLGNVRRLQGDLDAAQVLVERALALRLELAPDSIRVAESHDQLGLVAESRGASEAALAHWRQSLAIRRRLQPGSHGEAWCHHVIGARLAAIGRLEEAAENALAAVGALEDQMLQLGGTVEGRADFRAEQYAYYTTAVDTLVAAGRPADAFAVLERSRAWLLLAVMAERDLVLEPGAITALDQERRRLATLYDRWRAGLQFAEDEAERTSVREELERIRREQREVRDRIRQASPRLASVRYPQPLDLDGARHRQEPGTAVAAYSVGDTRTQLFTLWPGGTFQVATLDIGADALGERVAQLRGLCATPSSPLEVVEAAAASLYDELLAPAADALVGADRLLVVPDGPLHLLPFAVLAERTEAGVRFLVERLPVSTVVSLTVHSELEDARVSRSAAAVAVFADPSYDAARQGTDLAPLPGSRSEARAVAAHFGRRAEVFLGAQATEGRVRTLARATDIVHFATHVVLDRASPLDAAIALAPDGRDNGLLQAWEVFESVRVDARLITLSGCETGIGAARAGEGLMGLARAFQYAGARAVLASLWRVEDRAAAAFMSRFYAALVGGQRIDEALRTAQVELLQGAQLPVHGDGLLASVSRWLGTGDAEDGPAPPDLSHPFYWAAFRVEGDGW